MPILHVKALPQKNKVKVKKALAETTLAISKAYGCEQKQVWTTWTELTPEFYLEGTDSVDIQPTHSHPPICELICFEGKAQEVIEETLIVAANTLSSSLGISNNIFMTYHEAKSGQVVAGNGIVRRK